MKRIERIEAALRALPRGSSITTAELADQLALARANVSHDLNLLCSQGRAHKFGSKPVHYAAVHNPVFSPPPDRGGESSLDVFLQRNPSLYPCGEQAKAAVLYPPQGMHTLLLGETGTGKSMFARLIYDYAAAQNVLAPGGRFVTFNCADYAHNPQLLLAQLFGSQKGSYTGADADRPGILQQADGGVLFLDEVHRLPPEGQEMLFTFIDGGCYRRLGETESMRSATVLLLCATTEDPQSALLHTFLRRIPMVIRIPSLEQRDLDERLQLIHAFFAREGERLGATIQVSVNSLRALLSYPCPGNIGQLKTDIQLICAKAYAAYISGQKQDISVSNYDLPESIREGLYQRRNHRHIYRRLGAIQQRFIPIEPHSLPNWPDEDWGGSIYKLIQNRSRDMEELGLAEDAIQEELEVLLRQYYERIHSHGQAEDATGNMERIVGPRMAGLAKRLIALAEERLNRDYNANIRFGLAVHLQNALLRVRENRTIVNTQLYAIRRKYEEAFQVGLECLDVIREALGVQLPEDEAGFLAIFFSDGLVQQGSAQVPAVIVVAHGPSTASSMADTVNRLLGEDIVIGFDAPLDESPQQVYQRIRSYMAGRTVISDALLLVDMGSLSDFAPQLEEDLTISVKCVPLASTPHVLEAARLASLGHPLHHIWKQTLNVQNIYNPARDGETPLSQGRRLKILTVCATGDGTARLLKELLQERLDLAGRHCDIQPLPFADEDALAGKVAAIEKQGQIVATVSPFALHLPYRHFQLSELLDGSAFSLLQEIVDTEAACLGIRQELYGALDSLTDTGAFEDVRGCIDRMQTRLGIPLEREIYVGLLCHVGCALDRLLGGRSASVFQNKRRILDKYPVELSCIQQEMEALGVRYGVSLPMDEVCYAAAFFMKEDLIEAQRAPMKGETQP